MPARRRFVMAAADGLFGAEGLAVTTDIANGSPDAIARVAAGSSDFALVDINELIRFRRTSRTRRRSRRCSCCSTRRPTPSSPARAAASARSPTSKARSSASPKATCRSGCGRRWRRQNGIKIASVKQSSISAAVREPMLSAGQVDAVTGFSYLSAVNLRDRGVPADDLAVLRYADYGCEAYGFAVIVNPALRGREARKR